MGATFDVFVAALKCPRCGEVSKADGGTNMQTAIRAQPRLAYLSVGDALDVNAKAMTEAGYLTVRDPAEGEESRILQGWVCPSCRFPSNWAQVVVRAGLIAEISGVRLTREVLEGANYIEEEAGRNLAAELTQRPSLELFGPAVVQTLRERLP